MDDKELLELAAKAAIGMSGLRRLKSFFQLQAGWDGKASKPVNLNSIAVFSNFFANTGLYPEQLGIFMSAQGNLVVNWLDPEGQLIELEFLPFGVEYFIESKGEEGIVTGDDIGFKNLLNRLTTPIAT